MTGFYLLLGLSVLVGGGVVFHHGFEVVPWLLAWPARRAAADAADIREERAYFGPIHEDWVPEQVAA
jgi:hypothetical protein